jgi:hypothetical protein
MSYTPCHTDQTLSPSTPPLLRAYLPSHRCPSPRLLRVWSQPISPPQAQRRVQSVVISEEADLVDAEQQTNADGVEKAIDAVPDEVTVQAKVCTSAISAGTAQLHFILFLCKAAAWLAWSLTPLRSSLLACHSDSPAPPYVVRLPLHAVRPPLHSISHAPPCVVRLPLRSISPVPPYVVRLPLHSS